MRIRLTDGSYLETTNRDKPSKRRVKQGGGSLKRFHSQQTGRNVGGTTDLMKAIYADDVIDPETGERTRGLPVEMCKVVNGARLKTTWDLGGSCSTGYIGGKGL